MGLQPWVKVTSPTLPMSSSKKNKKPNYDEIKNLVKLGKINNAKSSVRDGDWDFNDDIRTRLWPFLVAVHESNNTAGGGDYWDTVNEIFHQGQNELPSSPIPLPTKCFPEETRIYYKLDDNGINICHRICTVINYLYPDITYCPLLCPIISIFLHYIEEEKVYKCVVTLLQAQHKLFLTQTKVQSNVCSQVSVALTKKYSKSTFTNLVRALNSDETVEIVFQDWLCWIFRDLPIQHLVRVMDCFLMEGIKVLYRVTISLLNNFIKQTSATGISNLKHSISEYCKSIQLSPAHLLKSSFSIRNFRSSEIKSVTTKLQFQVRSTSENNSSGKLTRNIQSSDSLPNTKSQNELCNASKTLSNVKELLTVWQWLPVRITMYEPKLIYTTNEDGCSLTTFFNRVEEYEPTLILLKVTSGEIFGAYLSTAWAVRNEKDARGERQRYFGTGETFIFGIYPEIIKYPWIGIKGKVEHAAELFMHADQNMICIGGGEGTGIQIDSDLRYGKTEKCLTFNNEPLVAGNDFEISVIEVFAFSIM